MRYFVKIMIAGSLLAGCEPVAEDVKEKEALEYKKVLPASDDDSQSESDEGDVIRPLSRPGAEDAEADSKKESSKQESNKAPVKSGALGETVASLGDPAQPGLWLKTPLVKKEQAGRLSYKGKNADVTLIPIDGPATAGSRMSVAAFQKLGAPLTDLVTLSVSG